MKAFYAVSQNVVQHPIAIQGNVKSLRRTLKGDVTKNVLNLQMPPSTLIKIMLTTVSG
ncbi:hypothetical protein [Pseudomonas asiatica]|uniref:hypothetical protein n=1 Tax=Pseudomonas asiatica TaxID=2219225 RepID=UPI0025A434CB|nr:hypothetical protein [Pseudomonas asiatica]WJN52571.1 hypothetical protein QUR91_12425 [Pseudomonas asiatica]